MKPLLEALNQGKTIVNQIAENNCNVIGFGDYLGVQDARQEKALMEMNFGDWEQKKWNDINPEELNPWMQDFVNVKPPNGENLAELYDRVEFFLDALRKQSYERVLLISHAGVIRCVWAYLLEIPLKNSFKIPVGFGEVFIFNLGTTKGLGLLLKLE